MGATLSDVDGNSIGHIPGARVVVRKDLVEPRPGTPAKTSFFEHLQQQPSPDSLSVNSGDLEKQISGAVVRERYVCPDQMHGSV